VQIPLEERGVSVCIFIVVRLDSGSVRLAGSQTPFPALASRERDARRAARV